MGGSVSLETMIVVTIIAIVIGLLVPNFIVKIQKDKSRGTIKDINLIARACHKYIDERGRAPAAGIQNGPLKSDSVFTKILEEKLLKICPVKDHWGNPIYVYSGSAAENFDDFSLDRIGDEDFIIVSYGSDGKADGFKYDPNHPRSGWFELDSMADFKRDYINRNGNWIQRPEPH
jgi:type II secretory pathway pseudopilin PulG